MVRKAHSQPTSRGGTLVIIGAGIAGWMAAAFNAPHYDDVYLIEADKLPDQPQSRKGTAQNFFTHFISAMVRQKLNAILPDLEGDMVAHGAKVGKWGENSRMFAADGRRFAEGRSYGVTTIAARKDDVDFFVGKHTLAKFNNVHVVDQTRVTGFEIEAGRIVAVKTQNTVTKEQDRCETNTVIAATGNRVWTKWLTEAGVKIPPKEVFEQRVDSWVQYIGAWYRNVEMDGRVFVASGESRQFKFGCGITDNGNNIYSVVAIHYGLPPGFAENPKTHEELVRFVKFVRPEIGAMLEKAELIEQTTGPSIRVFLETDNVRYFPEVIEDLPCNFIVIGKGLMDNDPRHGTGTSAAEIGAEMSVEYRDRAREFYPAFMKRVGLAWSLPVGADINHRRDLGDPTVPKVGFLGRILSGYNENLGKSVDDWFVAKTLIGATNMVLPAWHLMRPRMIFNALKHAIFG